MPEVQGRTFGPLEYSQKRRNKRKKELVDGRKNLFDRGEMIVVSFS